MATSLPNDPQDRRIPTSKDERTFDQDLEETLKANVKQALDQEHKIQQLTHKLDKLRGEHNTLADDIEDGTGGDIPSQRFERLERTLGATRRDVKSIQEQIDDIPFLGEYPLNSEQEGFVFGSDTTKPAFRDLVDIRDNLRTTKRFMVGSMQSRTDAQAEIRTESRKHLRLSRSSSDSVELEAMPAGTMGLHANTVELNAEALVPPRPYEGSLGTPQRKFLGIHGAELWIDQLVAQSTRATIGGKIFVGPTSSLTARVESDPTRTRVSPSDDYYNYIRIKHNSFDYDQVVMLEARGRVEFLRIRSAETVGHVDEPGELETLEWTEAGDGLAYSVGRDHDVWRLTYNPDADVQPDEVAWRPPDGETPGEIEGVWRLIEGAEPITTVDDGFDEDNPFEFTGGEYRYRVERALATERPKIWFEGDGVISTGSAGSGFIELYAQESMRNVEGDDMNMLSGPTIAFSIRDEDASTWTDEENPNGYYNRWSTRTALGRLDGHYDYEEGGYTWGMAAGNENLSWISADDSKGFRIMNYRTLMGQWSPEGFVYVGPQFGGPDAPMSMGKNEPAHPIEMGPDGSMVMYGDLRMPDGGGGYNRPANWKGVWTAGTTYFDGDTVYYEGGSYIATEEHVADSSNAPGESDSLWDVFAEKGEDGEPGDSGTPGEDAKVLKLTSESLVFQRGKNGGYTPAEITLTAETSNIDAPDLYWELGGVELPGAEAHTRTVGPDALTGKSVQVKVTETTTGLSDTATLVEVEEGSDSMTSVLTNENHTFQASSDGEVVDYSEGATDIKVFEGADRLDYGSGPGTFDVTIGTVNGVTHNAIDAVGDTATFTPTGMSGARGSVELIVTARPTDGDKPDVVQSKTVTYSKSIAGSAARTLRINAPSEVFVEKENGTYEPASIELTAQSQHLADGYTYTWNAGGTELASDTDTVTIDKNTVLNAPTPGRVEIELTADGLVDNITVVVVQEGSDGYTKALSNTTHTFPATSAGEVIDFAGGDGVVEIYRGAEKLSYSTGGEPGTFQVTAHPPDSDADGNPDVTLNTGGSGTTWTIEPTDMDPDVGIAVVPVDIEIGRDGLPPLVLNDKFVYVKSKAGVDAGSLRLTATGQVFTQDDADQGSPDQITITGVRQNISETVTFSTTPTGIPLSDVGTAQRVLNYSDVLQALDDHGGRTVSVKVEAGGLSDEMNFAVVKDGDPAITPVLSNQNHTYKATNDGDIDSLANGNCVVEIYQGAERLAYDDTLEPADGTFSISLEEDGINANVNEVVGEPDQAVIVPTSFPGDSGQLTLNITAIRRDGSEQVVTQVISYSKSVDGFDAEFVRIDHDVQVFRRGTDGGYDPSSLWLDAYSVNLDNPSFTWNVNNGERTDTGPDIEITTGDITDGQVNVQLQVDGSDLSDRITLPVVTDGTNAITTAFTNDSHTFAANTDGTIISADGSVMNDLSEGNCEIEVYEGGDQLTATDVTPTNLSAGQFTVTKTEDGISGAFVYEVGGRQNTLRYEPDEMPSAQASVQVVIHAKRADGSTVTQKHKLTYAKSRAGVDAELVRMTVPSRVFKKGQDDQYTPALIQASAQAENINEENFEWTLNGEAPPAGRVSEDGYTCEILPEDLTDGAVVVEVTETQTGRTDRETISEVAEGKDGLTVLVTNENHTYTADSDGNITGDIEAGASDVQVYLGAELLDVDETTSPGPKTFSVTKTETGISGDLTSGPDVYNYTPASMSADDGEVDLEVAIVLPSGETRTVTRSLTYGKSYAGQPSRSVRLSADTRVFVKDADGNLNPSDALIEAELNNITDEPVWEAHDQNGTLVSLDVSVDKSNATLLAGDVPEDGKVTVTVSAEGYSDALAFYVIKDGVMGEDGVDAITTVLSNQVHTYKADADGTLSSEDSWASGNCSVDVYEGTIDLGVGTGNGSFQLNHTVTSGTLDATVTGNTLEVNGMSTDKATVDLQISITRLDGATYTETRTLSYAKSIAGVNGKILRLSPQSQVFKVKNDSPDGPDPIQVDVQSVNIDDPIAWSSPSDSEMDLSTATDSGLLVEYDDFSGESVTLKIEADGLEDTVTLARLDEGSNTVTAILTNESHTFQADSEGVVSDYTGGATDVLVYEGITELTGATVTVQDTQGGITGSVNEQTYTPSDMSAENGHVDLQVTATRLNGETETRTKRVTYSKSLAGSDARSISIDAEGLVFRKGDDDEFTPSTLTLQAVSENMDNPTFEWTYAGTSEQGTSLTLGYQDVENAGGSLPVVLETSVDSSTYQDRVTLVTVAEGKDAVVLVLSNENHTFPADNAGNIIGDTAGSTCTVTGYQGVDPLTPSELEDPLTFEIQSVALTNVTEDTLTVDSFTPADVTADSGTAVLTIRVTGRDGVTNTYERTVTYSLSKQGDQGPEGPPGDNARLLSLEATSQVFVLHQDGSTDPDDITFTADTQHTVGSFEWSTMPTGITLTGTGDTRTLSYSDMEANDVVRVTAERDGVQDTISVVVVTDGEAGDPGEDGQDGQDAYTVFLTNESHTFPASNDGTVADFSDGKTTVRVYEGATERDPSTFNVSVIDAEVTGGISGNLNGPTYEPTAMSEDQGLVPLEVTVDGLVFERVVSYSKSLAGTDGAPGEDNQDFDFLEDAEADIADDYSGLIMTSERLGYIRPASEAQDLDGRWRLYMDNAGNMFGSSDSDMSVDAFVFESNVIKDEGTSSEVNTGRSFFSVGEVGVARDYLVDEVGNLPTGASFLGYHDGQLAVAGEIAAETFSLIAGGTEDSNGDHWSSEGSFQFGGSSGLSYNGSGAIEAGSDFTVAGEATISGNVTTTGKFITAANITMGSSVTPDGGDGFYINSYNFWDTGTPDGIRLRVGDGDEHLRYGPNGFDINLNNFELEAIDSEQGGIGLSSSKRSLDVYGPVNTDNETPSVVRITDTLPLGPPDVDAIGGATNYTSVDVEYQVFADNNTYPNTSPSRYASFGMPNIAVNQNEAIEYDIEIVKTNPSLEEQQNVEVSIWVSQYDIADGLFLWDKVQSVSGQWDTNTTSYTDSVQTMMPIDGYARVIVRVEPVEGFASEFYAADLTFDSATAQKYTTSTSISAKGIQTRLTPRAGSDVVVLGAGGSSGGGGTTIQGGGANTWEEVQDKPFEYLGGGLEVVSNTMRADVTALEGALFPIDHTDTTFANQDLNTSSGPTFDELTLTKTGQLLAFGAGYEMYRENTGVGSDNTRLWLDAPVAGEMVFGPRGGGDRVARIRLETDELFVNGGSGGNGLLNVRAYTQIDFDLNVDGTIDANGLTLSKDLEANEILIDFDVHRSFDLRRENSTTDSTAELLFNTQVHGNGWGFAHQGEMVMRVGGGTPTSFFQEDVRVYNNLNVDGDASIDGNTSITGLLTAGQATFNSLTVDYLTLSNDLSANEVLIDFDVHRDFDLRRQDSTDDGTAELLFNSGTPGNSWGFAHQGEMVMRVGGGSPTRFLHEDVDVDNNLNVKGDLSVNDTIDVGGSDNSIGKWIIGSGVDNGQTRFAPDEVIQTGGVHIYRREDLTEQIHIERSTGNGEIHLSNTGPLATFRNGESTIYDPLEVRGDLDVGDNLNVDGLINIPAAHTSNKYQLRAGSNTTAGVSIRSTDNPNSNQSLFAVESSGSFTRFGVTQNNGTFTQDTLWAGYSFNDGEVPSTSYALRVGGSAQVDGHIGTGDYTSGIFGSGWIIDPNAQGGVFAEFDNMRIRNEFRAHIFKKNVVKASNGYLLITDSAEVTETKVVSGTTDTIKIDTSSGNSSFSSGDLLWLKSMNDDGTEISGVKVEVTGTSTTGDETTLSVNVESGGQINDGDTIVRVSGGYLMNDASTQYAPFLAVYDGVNSWSDFQGPSKEKVRLGNLSGAAQLPSGTQPSGYGLRAENVFLSGHIEADSGAIGDLTLDNGMLRSDASLSNGQFVLSNSSTKIHTGAYSGTPSGVPTLSMLQGSDLNERMFVHMGETYSNGWTGRYGFSATEGKNTPALFEISKDLSNSNLTAQIAGWEFTSGALYREHNNTFISLGDQSGLPWSTNIEGLQIGTDANNRMWFGVLGDGTYELAVREQGNYKLRLGSGNNYIQGDLLVDGSVTADAIAAGSITANEIAVGALSAENIDVDSIFATNATIDGTLDIRQGTFQIGDFLIGQFDFGSASDTENTSVTVEALNNACGTTTESHTLTNNLSFDAENGLVEASYEVGDFQTASGSTTRVTVDVIFLDSNDSEIDRVSRTHYEDEANTEFSATGAGDPIKASVPANVDKVELVRTAIADSVDIGGFCINSTVEFVGTTEITVSNAQNFISDKGLVYTFGGNQIILDGEAGTIEANTKNFLIDHPTRQGYKLRHSTLEGPEQGIYHRGTTDARSFALPDYWATWDDYTVHLTAQEQGSVWVEAIEDGVVYVGQSRPDIEYSYLVIGKRGDIVVEEMIC